MKRNITGSLYKTASDLVDKTIVTYSELGLSHIGRQNYIFLVSFDVILVNITPSFTVHETIIT